MRIARPGARLCVTEAELPLSNSSAGTRLSHLISRALKRAGFGFSPPEELDIGIIPRLGDLMRAAGWVEIQFKTHIENLSAGTANHDEWYENYEVMLHLLEPFLRRTTGIEQRELEQVQADFLHDIHSQEFSGVQFFLSAWGSRP